MLPTNPLPPLTSRPLLLIGLAAQATALALWARRKVQDASRGQRLIRVEPTEQQLQTVVEVPWGTEVR